MFRLVQASDYEDVRRVLRDSSFRSWFDLNAKSHRMGSKEPAKSVQLSVKSDELG